LICHPLLDKLPLVAGGQGDCGCAGEYETLCPGILKEYLKEKNIHLVSFSGRELTKT
jgi:hypothetical protein